jgi:tetratricopeptide (TPR) repeat protein
MSIHRTTLVGLGLVIFVSTLWLYWPTVHGEFLVGMDDDVYVQQAAQFHGLTPQSILWAFTNTQPYYHPLPRLSHLLDYQLWGRNVVGHHATNVVLHALNAALVFGFVWTVLSALSLATGERLALAMGVGMVFAVHPLQAESVAWISGRTQLLCMMFGIGSVWAYAAGAPRWQVWGLYIGALLCKPMAVSLPFVMLAIDYFPLRRLERFRWERVMRELGPWIALGLIVALGATISEARHGGLMLSLSTVPLSQRVYLMFHSLTFYPWKLLWPVRLLPFYPLRADFSLGQWRIFGPMLLVVAITALALRERHRLPALVAGWGAYLVLLLPVSGLVQTGSQAVATRYAYLAILPLLLLVGGLIVWAWRRSAKLLRLGLVGVVAVALGLFVVRTRTLLPNWRDTETLWQTVLTQFPNSQIATRSLVLAYLNQGRSNDALRYAERYIEIAPQAPESHDLLGYVLNGLNRFPEAAAQFELALQINPNLAEVHCNLGNTLCNEGQLPQAIEHYQRALRINPAFTEAHYNLGFALEKTGRVTEAISQYQQALTLRPDFAPAQAALARLQASR